MQQIHFTDPRASERLQGLFKASRLIPFFGSGFTKGMSAKNGRVPDAKGLVSAITQMAAAQPGLSSTEIQQVKDVTELKRAFGLLSMSKYVKPAQARALLGNVFSDTTVSDDWKKRLLKLDWPHIFTFNIDDAIENVARKYQQLSPNRKVSREFISANKCLLKIHGDIADYLKYDDASLIFTWREYAHSISANQAMLSFLREEAANSSFLFIGCSLDAEIDLLHLAKDSVFSKSIFLSKGQLSLNAEIAIADYGIEQVIYFDTYDEICEWVATTLKGLGRQQPYRNLKIDDSVLSSNDAISYIANGGPVTVLNDEARTARVSKSFPRRTVVTSAATELGSHECLLVTGRRFSGKTLFLLQLIEYLKEYNSIYFASTDLYTSDVKRRLEGVENYLFVFDSNYLDMPALNEVLYASIHSSSKLVICASSGDAELFRYRLDKKGVNFHELKLSHSLDGDETKEFNKELSSAGVPVYIARDALLNFSFKYYDEFRSRLGVSALFGKSFDDNAFCVLILIGAFGKAEFSHIKAFDEYFDVGEFVRRNDRLFEVEQPSGSSAEILVCNSSSWLIKTLREFLLKDIGAVNAVAKVIVGLKKVGFIETSRNLISFDKLNELGGGGNMHALIRDVYSEIHEAYKEDLHYWLQRAKSELISARSLTGLAAGMQYAHKVRVDSVGEHKQSTYYSATLVLAQLHARAYIMGKNPDNLVGFIDHCTESINNYLNNKRHIDEMVSAKSSDAAYTLSELQRSTPIELLSRKDEINQLVRFFGM